jgi:hypothetical protein
VKFSQHADGENVKSEFAFVKPKADKTFLIPQNKKSYTLTHTPQERAELSALNKRRPGILLFLRIFRLLAKSFNWGLTSAIFDHIVLRWKNSWARSDWSANFTTMLGKLSELVKARKAAHYFNKTNLLDGVTAATFARIAGDIKRLQALKIAESDVAEMLVDDPVKCLWLSGKKRRRSN